MGDWPAGILAEVRAMIQSLRSRAMDEVEKKLQLQQEELYRKAQKLFQMKKGLERTIRMYERFENVIMYQEGAAKRPAKDRFETVNFRGLREMAFRAGVYFAASDG